MNQLSSLEEWETYVTKHLDDVDLLGEIVAKLPQEAPVLLGSLIGDLVRKFGWEEATEILERKYPHSFAVYLVAQGLQGYEAGNFWSAVRKTTRLDLSPKEQSAWGQLFEKIVMDMGGPPFPILEGHRYVTPILLHGGIPKYCLPDFFQYFLQISVTRAEYAALSAPDFLEERLSQSAVQSEVDKPVIRFLKYGGRVAEDFFERCRELAFVTAEKGKVPSPEEVGLPAQVVESYQTWIHGKIVHLQRPQAKYFKPKLLFDPWHYGVTLFLPPQRLSNPRVTWRIHADTQLLEEKEEVAATSGGSYIPLPVPTSEYRVELVLHRQGEEGEISEGDQRVWHLPGIEENCPIMFFDSRTRELIVRGEILPASYIWVIRSPCVELRTEPTEALQVTERFPRLPWEWTEFQAEEIDLRKVHKISVSKEGRTLCEFYVREQKQPFLEGGRTLPVDDDGPPLYIGDPPAVCIPLPPVKRGLRRWHVQLRSEGPAYPMIDRAWNLGELASSSHEETTVKLGLVDLLGVSPMGTYQVTVRGPLGNRSKLAFRIIPKLEVAGLENPQPPPGGSMSPALLLETSPEIEVHPQSGAKGCRLVKSVDSLGLYECYVDENICNIPLRFSLQRPARKLVCVDVSLLLRRLRWRLILNRQHAMKEDWKTKPLCVPIEAIEQADQPYLFVDLFGGVYEGIQARLDLEADDGQVVQQEHCVLKKGQRYLRFLLSAYLDTMRHMASAEYKFRLTLRNVPGWAEQVCFHVLTVTRQFIVENLDYDCLLQVNLRWSSPVRLRNRLVRLRSRWCPWLRPVEVPIPDKIDNEYSFVKALEELPPGEYSLEFDVQTDWAPSHASAASPSRKYILRIPKNIVGQRLKELKDVRSEPAEFELILERAFLYDSLNLKKKSIADFRWCIENIDRASVAQALAILCHLHDEDCKKILLNKLKQPDWVRKVLDALDSGELEPNSFRRYQEELCYVALPLGTCNLLLDVRGHILHKLSTHCLKTLLGENSPRGVEVLLEWLETGSLDEEQATALCKGNRLFVSKELKKKLPDPYSVRLLDCLHRQFPRDIQPVWIHPGYWVRTPAGWGKIKEILDRQGKSVPKFLSCDYHKYQLKVELRGHDPRVTESVQVDFYEDIVTITFLNGGPVYICEKCRKFATGDRSLLTDQHDVMVHEGRQPRYSPNPGGIVRVRGFERTEFLHEHPTNPWE